MSGAASLPGDGATIGTDESGKGDYCGPLSDPRVRRRAETVRRTYPTSVVDIGPER